MNEIELQKLKDIVADKYSVGSFAGMIYNKKMDFKMKGLAIATEDLITEAIQVRLTMEELANGTKEKSE